MPFGPFLDPNICLWTDWHNESNDPVNAAEADLVTKNFHKRVEEVHTCTSGADHREWLDDTGW